MYRCARVAAATSALVANLHLVVGLVTITQSAQDRDRVLNRWLLNQNRLEAPFECGVGFHVLAVLIECRGADGMELAAREHGLEHVGRVHGAVGRARSNHGV